MRPSTSIPLDLNESYWLFPRELEDECMPRDARTYATYPDYAGLVRLIAERAGVPPESVVLSNGSDAVIRLIYEHCAAHGLRSLVPIPTFSGYEAIARQIGYGLGLCRYTEESGRFRFPMDEVLHALETRSTDVLFLCQPNNPLGTALTGAELESVLGAAKAAGILVVADEAYSEFTGETCVQRTAEQPLLILRTFSKSYGLAGIRVGYAITNEQLAGELKARLLPWPVTGASAHAALKALEHEEAFRERRCLLIEERERFSAELSAIPSVTVYPSAANFVLIRVRNAEAVAAKLLESSIRSALGETKTTDPAARKLLTDTMRLSVPSPEDRTFVMNALRGALETLDK